MTELAVRDLSDLTLAEVLSMLAGILSRDLGPGLGERAALLLDQHLNGRDLREVAIQSMLDQARDRARNRTAVVERAATTPFTAPPHPGPSGEG